MRSIATFSSLELASLATGKIVATSTSWRALAALASHIAGYTILPGQVTEPLVIGPVLERISELFPLMPNRKDAKHEATEIRSHVMLIYGATVEIEEGDMRRPKHLLHEPSPRDMQPIVVRGHPLLTGGRK